MNRDRRVDGAGWSRSHEHAIDAKFPEKISTRKTRHLLKIERVFFDRELPELFEDRAALPVRVGISHARRPHRSIADASTFQALRGSSFRRFVDTGRNPVVLAGLVWKTLMRHNERELAQVNSAQQFEVNYTNFVADPIGMMERVREYCELRPSEKFDVRIRKIKIHNADDKWKRDLDEEQKRLLHETIADDLTHFGFEL